MVEPIRIKLTGHLTRSNLGAALSQVEPNLKESRTLIVDCSALTGYDAEARALFVEWNVRHRARLRAVALVSQNDFWPVLVSAMALASRQRMRVFHDENTALNWANGTAD